MSAEISNSKDLCNALEEEVSSKTITSEELTGFVTNLSFAERIPQEDPVHELKNTEDTQSQIELLARIYATHAKESPPSEIQKKTLQSLLGFIGGVAHEMVQKALDRM